MKRFIKPISKTGRNIVMDKWYNSVQLATELLNIHNRTVIRIVFFFFIKYTDVVNIVNDTTSIKMYSLYFTNIA